MSFHKIIFFPLSIPFSNSLSIIFSPFSTKLPSPLLLLTSISRNLPSSLFIQLSLSFLLKLLTSFSTRLPSPLLLSSISRQLLSLSFLLKLSTSFSTRSPIPVFYNITLSSLYTTFFNFFHKIIFPSSYTITLILSFFCITFSFYFHIISSSICFEKILLKIYVRKNTYERK